jgi:hypothetical protein
MHSEEEWNCVQGVSKKTWRKKTLGRPRRGWKDNITIDIKGI